MQIVSNDDKEQQNELQGLLCGTLQVIVQKLGPAAVLFADSLMHSSCSFGAKELVPAGGGAHGCRRRTVRARAAKKEGAGPHREFPARTPAAAHTHIRRRRAFPRASRSVDGPLRSRMPRRPC